MGRAYQSCEYIWPCRVFGLVYSTVAYITLRLSSQYRIWPRCSNVDYSQQGQQRQQQQQRGGGYEDDYVPGF